ncbi:NAD/NADP octopine/nopaline dehydrogenase family protein [Devosia sp. A369]
MRISIIGAGPAGMLAALFGSKNGHQVTVFSPRGVVRAGGMTDDTLSFESYGAIEASASVTVIRNLAELESSDVVLIALPATAYQAVLPKIVPHLHDEQIVVFSGALSLVPLWVDEQARRLGKQLTLVGWGTTLGTARIHEDGRLKVGTVRGPFEMAVIPSEQAPRVVDVLKDAFGLTLRLVSSMLTPLLSNVNPVAHAGQSIPNLTRMESGEAWSLFENFMDVGANIAEAVDAERRAIATGFGLRVRSLREHYHLSYHVPEAPLPQIAKAIVNNGASPFGPSSIVNRYLDEDVPFGLVVYEVLGKVLKIETPATTAAITILEIAKDTPYRQTNTLISDLGLESMSPATLLARASGNSHSEPAQCS